jgi:hypothetical protein
MSTRKALFQVKREEGVREERKDEETNAVHTLTYE